MPLACIQLFYRQEKHRSYEYANVKAQRFKVLHHIACSKCLGTTTVCILQFLGEVGIENLPEGLQQAAFLRIANPDMSLADLAVLSDPPVTKSCLNHRLKKLMAMAKQL